MGFFSRKSRTESNASGNSSSKAATPRSPRSPRGLASDLLRRKDKKAKKETFDDRCRKYFEKVSEPGAEGIGKSDLNKLKSVHGARLTLFLLAGKNFPKSKEGIISFENFSKTLKIFDDDDVASIEIRITFLFEFLSGFSKPLVKGFVTRKGLALAVQLFELFKKEDEINEFVSGIFAAVQVTEDQISKDQFVSFFVNGKGKSELTGIDAALRL